MPRRKNGWPLAFERFHLLTPVLPSWRSFFDRSTRKSVIPHPNYLQPPQFLTLIIVDTIFDGNLRMEMSSARNPSSLDKRPLFISANWCLILPECCWPLLPRWFVSGLFLRILHKIAEVPITPSGPKPSFIIAVRWTLLLAQSENIGLGRLP